MTTRAAGRARRSPTVATWPLFVRRVSVEWEVRETAGCRGRRIGRRRRAPLREGRHRHRPLVAPAPAAGSVNRSPGAPDSLRDASDRKDNNCANCFTPSTCCSRSSMSERWTEPCSSQPLIRRLNEEVVSSRCSATAASSSGCPSNSARHKPVSRPGRQSGRRRAGSDGTTQPRYTARMTPRSSTSLRSQQLGDQVLVAVRLRRLPDGHLVGGRRHPDQPPQPFAPFPVPQPDPLTGFELRARRDEAEVRRPDACRDHRVAVQQHVERLRVVQIHRRRPRLIRLFALHQVDLRRRRQQHPHRQLDARVETGQRAGRFCAVGLDLNIPRRTDEEVQTEGAADLLDAVQAGDVPVQD